MRPIRSGRRDVARVALSFDDGPGPRTAALLDRLAQLRTPATFFVVGAQAEARPALVERIASAGHELGSHSHTHRRGACTEREELERSSAALGRITGTAPRWFRPPYNDWSPALVARAREAGMQTVCWDVDPRDWECREPETVRDRVADEVRPGSIVVLHESAVTIAALAPIVTGLRDAGLEPVPLSALLGAG